MEDSKGVETLGVERPSFKEEEVESEPRAK
jgi:hypothetical protein